jgi:hypothetical protein
MFKEKFIKFYEKNLDKFNFLIVLFCWLMSFGMLIFSSLIIKGKYDGIIFNEYILHIIGVTGLYVSILSIMISFITTKLVYEAYQYSI